MHRNENVRQRNELQPAIACTKKNAQHWRVRMLQQLIFEIGSSGARWKTTSRSSSATVESAPVLVHLCQQNLNFGWLARSPEPSTMKKKIETEGTFMQTRHQMRGPVKYRGRRKAAGKVDFILRHTSRS